MSAGTTAATRSAASRRRGVTPPPGQPLRTRPRRRGMVAGGVLLVLVCGVLAGVLYLKAGGKVSVIVTARPVPAGQVIDRADLTTAQIAADSIPAYAGAHMSEVVGKTTAVGVVTGEIVSPAMLTVGSGLPAGSAVVGVAVKPGQLPASGLNPGDVVMVVLLSPTSAAGTSTATSNPGGAASVLTDHAPVVDTATLPAGAGDVISVQVPRTDAAALAAASSAGLVALVRVPAS